MYRRYVFRPKFLFFCTLLLLFSRDSSAAPYFRKNSAASSNEKIWNHSDRLRWKDFKGIVPPRHDGPEAAVSTCGLGYEIIPCDRDGNFSEVHVYNLFFAQESWVKPDATESYLLDHEQGHFDLCEVYARLFREKLAQAERAHVLSDAEVSVIYAEIIKMYEAAQQLYEQQTVHGTNLAVQEMWDCAIDQALQMSCVGGLAVAAP